MKFKLSTNSQPDYIALNMPTCGKVVLTEKQQHLLCAYYSPTLWHVGLYPPLSTYKHSSP